MAGYDPKIASTIKRSRLLAKRHARQQTTLWRRKIRSEIKESDEQISKEVYRMVSGKARRMSAMRKYITASFDPSTAQSLCEYIPDEERLGKLAYRSCKFGISLVSKPDWIPNESNVVVIPSDDENCPSPGTVGYTDDEQEDDTKASLLATLERVSIPHHSSILDTE